MTPDENSKTQSEPFFSRLAKYLSTTSVTNKGLKAYHGRQSSRDTLHLEAAPRRPSYPSRSSELPASSVQSHFQGRASRLLGVTYLCLLVQVVANRSLLPFLFWTKGLGARALSEFCSTWQTLLRALTRFFAKRDEAIARLLPCAPPEDLTNTVGPLRTNLNLQERRFPYSSSIPPIANRAGIFKYPTIVTLWPTFTFGRIYFVHGHTDTT